MNIVMAVVIKFFFLMVFPTLLSPAALAESGESAYRADLFVVGSQVVTAESHSNAYTLMTEFEAEETESESSNTAAVPFIYSIDIDNRAVIYGFLPFIDDDWRATAFLSYLSLFSLSPPLHS